VGSLSFNRKIKGSSFTTHGEKKGKGEGSSLFEKKKEDGATSFSGERGKEQRGALKGKVPFLFFLCSGEEKGREKRKEEGEASTYLTHLKRRARSFSLQENGEREGGERELSFLPLWGRPGSLQPKSLIFP